MVNPKTVGVERSGVGIAGVEIERTRNWVAKSVFRLGAIRERKRIEKRLHRSYCILSRQRVSWIRVGHIIKAGLRQPKPQPFVGKEKEGHILDDWAAKCRTEVVLPFFSLGQWRVISEPVKTVIRI